MRKYRFRKAYIISEDNEIFGNILTKTIYQDREYALEVCTYQQNKAISDANMQFNKGKPIPVHKVHGFYLVHDSLFDEILKSHFRK